VTSIGEYAFSDCTNLQYNTYNNAKYLGNAYNPYMALIEANDTSITSCTIHADTKIISGFAFSNCKSLTSITIPDGVTSIGKGAFSECRGLVSITLPFVGQNKDGTGSTFFGYIFGASSIYDVEYYVPASLKTVRVTGGASIGSWAFYNCTGLTGVVIPDSVTSIDRGAFSGCTGLKNITFTGTQAQWNAIHKWSDWNYNTGSYTIYCTDGRISK